MPIKYPKIPHVFIKDPSKYKLLNIKGITAIAAFEQTVKSEGLMYLEEHLMIFVLDGVNILTHGDQQFTISKNQMILLPCNTVWKFSKAGNPNEDNRYNSMLFFLKDEFISDFIKIADIKNLNNISTNTLEVRLIQEALLPYLNSLRPYFNANNGIDSELVRLKIIELLYNLLLTEPSLLQHILQLRQNIKSDLISVLEQHYTDHLTLAELAKLSGRSLSTFKREFMSIYNIYPSLFIRNKRLEKAQSLLRSTSLNVAEVCYMSGFENIAHFSMIYKKRYGYTPSAEKKT
ncbi:AraC family transcriptional regulator [Dysgonomonas capnocytophagoides]|uniref:AraC family transcriptional regulator n=1 Tax=Dysgonomonas capnocytophagoides TaxID=45254 RepID=A0A4Y8L836_9BACT|nr:AraC family transcriptional regulator [Dysgonomonas capnocytophagoides]TFD98785.1 AraC family transcriptional regulator [Dysgonomonas capnocytophagoides]